jgi:hypothetical protein
MLMNARWRAAATISGLVSLLLAAACGGAPVAPEASGPTASRVGRAEPSVDTLGYELPAHAPGSSFPEQPLARTAADTRITRLNHARYAHTVQDLFGLHEPLALTFAPDALDGFGFDTSNAFQVDLRLGPQYRAAAEALAERAVQEPALFGRIVPCVPTAPGCRDEFLRSFGAQVFRRPLSATDLEVFQRFFDTAAASGEAPFEAGVRRSVAAMLQSPEFLYLSFGVARAAGGAGALAAPDDYEVAARLSYFLYDSMPDEALFAAARAGRLHTPDQVEAAARHMLTQPRVLDELVDFHEQLWQFERFARISPDASTYPNAPKNLVQSVRYATKMFVRDVLRGGGGLTELLTAPYAYADRGLSVLYGVPSRPGAGRFARIDFDPAARRGLLLQVGYLASNAYSVSTDPIHRGLFVIRNLLCRDIPDPPPGATTTPAPETDRPIVTTRDEVDLVTGQSFCPTCHTEINAPGFAFEGFDAVGQQRATENGARVDTSASMLLDGQVIQFNGAVELVSQISRSREAHRCYSRRWMEFAYGRPLAESDLATLDRIASRSLPIADIIVAIVRSPAFLGLPSVDVPSGDAASRGSL